MSQDAAWRGKFFTIWVGQQLSQAGSFVARFALIWWLTEATESATVLATATMVAFIPSILLSPFTGALVDRWNRRSVMILSDGFIALVSLWLGYLFWSGMMRPWHVYIVMLARALGGAFHGPAISASTTLLVPKEHYTQVAGLNRVIGGFLSLFGAPLGALALALLPLHGVMMIDVVTASFAILPLVFLTIPQPERTHVSALRATTIWANTWEGLRFIFRWPGLLAIVGLIGGIKLLVFPALSLAPLLILKEFGRGETGLALYQSMAGAGTIAGGLLIGVWGAFRRKIQTIVFGLSGAGLGILLIGLAPPSLFWLVLIGVGLFGMLQSIASAPYTAVIQATVPPRMQGRVFATMGSLLSIASPIALAIAGPVADLLGVRICFLVGGLGVVILPLLAYLAPALRGFEKQAPAMAKPSEAPASSQD